MFVKMIKKEKQDVRHTPTPIIFSTALGWVSLTALVCSFERSNSENTKLAEKLV